MNTVKLQYYVYTIGNKKVNAIRLVSVGCEKPKRIRIGAKRVGILVKG
jgi:hypothetical protein